MQQSSFNDMQLLRQHIMFKKLQEHHRQQQLQQLGDVKQQTQINMSTKRASGGQLPPQVNGTPVRDASQVFMNSLQHGSFPAPQENTDRMIFQQEQSQTLHSMNMAPQQHDASLYGTPIGSLGGNTNQYSYPHSIPQDSANFFTKATGTKSQKQMQPLTFSNPFLGDQCTVSPEHLSMPQGTYVSRQGFPIKNNFGQITDQDLNSGNTMENPHQGNSLRTYESMGEFGRREDRANWPGTMEQKTTQLGRSQDAVPLDPLEAELLYNMDDNMWGTSLGRHIGTASGGIGSTLDQAEIAGLPSLQSGSWSALMQSAVAEASGGDTEIQEQWSGLTFQNMEPSADNQCSSIMESVKKDTDWVENNLQSAPSFTSKPFPIFVDSSMSSSFRGFQQSGLQYLNEKEEGLHQEVSHESIHGSRRSAGEGVNCDPQQKLAIESNQQAKAVARFDNAWPDHNGGQSPSVSRDTREVMYMGRDPDSVLWKTNRSNGITDGGERHIGRFIGNNSHSGMNLDKGKVYNIQENSKETGEMPPRLNLGSASATIDQSHVFDSPNITAQRSEKMLEILNKGDHSRQDRKMSHICCNDNNSSTEVSAQTVNLNPRQVNSESGERSQSWLASPSSVQSSPSTNDLSQRANWDSRSGGQSSVPLYMAMGNSGGLTASTLFYGRNQQMQLQSDAPIELQSSQEALPGTSSRYPSTNLDPPHDARHISGNHVGQQFPVLEAMRISHPLAVSAMFQQGALSERPHNVWTSVPTQRHSSMPETQKVSSINPPKETTMINSWASEELNGQNSQKGRYDYPDLGASGGTEINRNQKISSEVVNTSRQSGLSEDEESEANHLSDANAHSHQQNLVVQHGNNFAPAKSERNIESFGRSMQPPHVSHQSYSLLNQVKAKKDADIDKSTRLMNGPDGSPVAQQASGFTGQQSLYLHNSRFRHGIGSGFNSISHINTCTSLDTKIPSFLIDPSEDEIVKAPLQPGERDTLSVGMERNVASTHAEYSQVNLHVAPTWFKKYGNFRNGQLLPSYDQTHGKTTPDQFSLGNSSQNLHSNASLGLVDVASVSQGASVWPSTSANAVASENASIPYALPPDNDCGKMTIMRSRKRKFFTVEVLPWHKEVIQGSQRHKDISMQEEDWAQATNRLIEKVEGGTQFIEERKHMFRSKRRLIWTTQLMQQLICPAPATILSTDATSHYDSLTYFVTRLSLGDACSMICCAKTDLNIPPLNIDANSEKLKAFERIVEGFSDRAKKLENDFRKLDKMASLVDIRVECQDLERFFIINRFAKFHIRGQADTTITAPKIYPHRYVTAIPMPQNLPEGVQCLSL